MTPPDNLASDPPLSRPQFQRTDVAILTTLFIGTIVLYARTATFGFVNFDDFNYISNNPYIKLGFTWAGIRWALTTGRPLYWHPLTWLMYLFMTSVFGLHPGPLHVPNFILHAASASLLFCFLLRSTRQRWPAAVAAALFAWHPLRVESVAWISETKDALAGCFCMLTLLLYARYADRRTWKLYAAVTVSYLLALTAKPTAVTLPIALLLLDYWPLRRPLTWRLLAEKIPWLILAGLAAFLAYHFQESNGALNLDAIIPLPVRMENATVSTILYLARNIFPHRLAVFYPHPAMIGRVIPLWQWGGSIVLILIFTILAVAYRKIAPFVCVGWLWFLGTLVPMIGIIQAGEQAMADRHSLIPSIGLIVAAVWTIAALSHGRRLLTPWLTVVTASILVVAWIASWIQIGYWRNSETLFTQADANTPENYIARAILASDMLDSPGDHSRALALARSAVQICPLVPSTHHTLALALEDQEKYHEAFPEYEAAIRLDPYSWRIRCDFGGLLVQMGRDQDAIGQFRRAIQLNSQNAEVRHDLAMSLASDGKEDQAIVEWEGAVAVDPKFGPAQGWLAVALERKGDRAGAVEHFWAAINNGERRPAWLTELAWLLATDPYSTADQIRQSLTYAQEACDKTHRSDAKALDALAAALARSGQFDLAAAAAQQGIDAANAAKQPPLAKAIQTRMMLYSAGQPYLAAQ